MAKTKAIKESLKHAGQKVEVITTRVSPELKAELEDAALRNKRSVSQEIEGRLKESLSGGADKAFFGCSNLKALALAVAQLANTIESGTGKNWANDAFTHLALVSGIEALLHYAGPEDALDNVEAPDGIRKSLQITFPSLMKNSSDSDIAKAYGSISGINTKAILDENIRNFTPHRKKSL